MRPGVASRTSVIIFGVKYITKKFRVFNTELPKKYRHFAKKKLEDEVIMAPRNMTGG